MNIRLLQDYSDFKVGDLLDTKNDEDGNTLIADGIAEKYIPVSKTEEEDDSVSLVNEVVEQVKTELKELSKSEAKKIPAQPKDHKAPWNGFGNFAAAVAQGKTNTKLMNWCESQKISGMGEAINVDGGFLIPPEFSTAILTALARSAVIAPTCMNIPVNNNIELPFVNITSQATSWTGGATVYKPAEGVAKTASVPQLGKVEMKLQKMAVVVYATDELINDSPIGLQSFLTTMVSTELALTKDEDIVNGSGAGEALGIINAPATISVGKETGQAATTIVTENVLKMASRMYAPSFRNAVWLIAQDALPQIATLSLAVGTGGAPVFISDIKNPLGPSLLGRPIIWSPHCQTLGTTGDIFLADFSQYVTITKAGMGMETATSIHLKFLEDETAFRFVVRCNGQPWWASAITPKHGSSTVSPFIKLDTRS